MHDATSAHHQRQAAPQTRHSNGTTRTRDVVPATRASSTLRPLTLANPVNELNAHHVTLGQASLAPDSFHRKLTPFHKDCGSKLAGRASA